MNFLQKFFHKKHKTPFLFFVAGFLLGAGIFLICFYLHTTLNQGPTSIRENNGMYHFINPLLECESTDGVQELVPFQTAVQNEIDTITATNKSDFIAVYFRDMNNGPWFSINGDEKFTPASLLKVPIMMSYYKVAESDPSILQKKILFTGSTDSAVPYFKSQGLVKGESYTVEELIERMIIDSDNDAKDLLVLHADPDQINDVFKYLNVDASDPNLNLSVMQYAAFFRILFNASYLNNDYSEKALSLLSKVVFKQGLAAGLPTGTRVADKYGERPDVLNGDNQLHDCGIIYYPNHPYLLCVMTRGNDFNILASVISDVSKTVYSEVDKQFQ